MGAPQGFEHFAGVGFNVDVAVESASAVVAGEIQGADAGFRSLRRQIHQGEKMPIPTHQVQVRVEHGEPILHGVQGRLEQGGALIEFGGPPLELGDLLEQFAARLVCRRGLADSWPSNCHEK